MSELSFSINLCKQIIVKCKMIETWDISKLKEFLDISCLNDGIYDRDNLSYQYKANYCTQIWLKHLLCHKVLLFIIAVDKSFVGLSGFLSLFFFSRCSDANRLKKTNPYFIYCFSKIELDVFNKRDVLHIHYRALKSLKYKTEESLVNILWYIVMLYTCTLNT